jgi:hypothetical protein
MRDCFEAEPRGMRPTEIQTPSDLANGNPEFDKLTPTDGVTPPNPGTLKLDIAAKLTFMPRNHF